MWAEMTTGEQLGPAQRVLLEEACRIVDRLDRLDAQLDGRDWLSFDVGRGGPVTVVVDRVLSEARQQAAVLKQIVAELRQSTARQSRPAVKETGIADLAARIAARRDSSAG